MIRMRLWLAKNIWGMLNITKAVLIGIILVLVINIQVSNARQAQATRNLAVQTKHIADQINQAVKEEKANTNMQLAEANAHLDCIARFFAQPNRTNTSIVDLDQCSIAKTSSTGSSGAQPSLTSPRSPVQTQPPSQTTVNHQSPVTVNPQPQPSEVQQILNGATGVLQGVGGFISGLI